MINPELIICVSKLIVAYHLYFTTTTAVFLSFCCIQFILGMSTVFSLRYFDWDFRLLKKYTNMEKFNCACYPRSQIQKQRLYILL